MELEHTFSAATLQNLEIELNLGSENTSSDPGGLRKTIYSVRMLCATRTF